MLNYSVIYVLLDHECPIPTFIIPDERHTLPGGGGGGG